MVKYLLLKLRLHGGFLPLMALFCLLLGSYRLHAGTGDNVIQKVQTKFKSLKSLSLRFTVHYESAGDSSVEQGMIYLQGQDRFRMETGAQAIICDGATIWAHNLQENQVIIYNSTSDDQPFFIPRQLLFDYPHKYRIQAVEEVELDQLPCYLLLMLPRDVTDPARLLEVWVDRKEHFTRRLQLVDVIGNRTIFDFRDFVSGQNLPDSTFHFVPPETAEVIDAR